MHRAIIWGHSNIAEAQVARYIINCKPEGLMQSVLFRKAVLIVLALSITTARDHQVGQQKRQTCGLTGIIGNTVTLSLT